MWIQRDGQPVQAYEFGGGKRQVPGQKQRWDRDGSYYITTIGSGEFAGRDVRLAEGDFVCVDEDGIVCDVQSNGVFKASHVYDAAVVAKAAKPDPLPPPTVAMTAAELLASREKPKLISDAPEAGEVKRRPGRPKGSKTSKTSGPLSVDAGDLEDL